MRNFLIHILTGITALSCTDKAITESSRPNVIFLLADDMRVGAMGYEGNEIIKTPAIDQLANSGVYFKNSFVTTPICSSSRASILTGQYTRKHGITDFHTNLSDSALSQTYPMLLKASGYYTGFIGKYGVGMKEDELPKDKFDYWKGLHGEKYWGQGHYWQDSVHLTKVMEGQALKFLDQAPKDRPFCLSLSFKAPHCQDSHPDQFLYDTTRYSHLYADETIPEAPLSDPEYWEMFPEFFQLGDSSETRIRWRRRFGTPELYQEMVKSYYRLISGIDATITAIRTDLREKGLDKNTIIIFSSDNGFYLGERGLAGKWFSHEESIRVPLIIYDPREELMEGSVSEQIALNIDLAPTILDLAGIEIPLGMQGKSLLSEMNDQTDDWRTDFFFEHRFERFNIPESEGVINLNTKYVRYVEEEPDYEYLYDLESDPDEVINYKDSAAYTSQVDEMRTRYYALLKQIEN
ncbi:MAG: sulfatase [Cyclobacteriaceae bacterium]